MTSGHGNAPNRELSARKKPSAKNLRPPEGPAGAGSVRERGFSRLRIMRPMRGIGRFRSNRYIAWRAGR